MFRFGESVAVGEGFVVVGTEFAANPSNPEADGGSGAAYVFEREGETWTLAATLKNDDADVQINEFFGASVAVSGNSIFVGSPSNDAADMNQSGAVYVFERPGDAWTQTAKLTDPTPVANESFGYLLAADAEGAIAGSGMKIYPIEQSMDVWSVDAGLALGDYPYAVARMDKRILSVDYGNADGTIGHVFAKEDAVWEEVAFPLPRFTVGRDELVSLSRRHAFVGVPTQDGGEVLIYDLGLTTSGESAPPNTAGLVLTVAPNPIRGAANVRYTLPHPGSAQFIVYDVLGREVLWVVEEATVTGPHEARFDMSGLAGGLYLVRLETQDGAVTRLITVVR